MVDEKLDEMMRVWNEEVFFFVVIFDIVFKFKVGLFLGQWVMWGFVLIICVGLVFWFWLLF